MRELVGGATAAEIRLAIIEAMIKLAGHGSVPAANSAAKLVDELETAQLQEDHAEKMANEKPEAIVEYLAALGASPAECLNMAHCKPSKKAAEAFERGQNERLMCARLAERKQALRSGRTPAWMAFKYDPKEASK